MTHQPVDSADENQLTISRLYHDYLCGGDQIFQLYSNNIDVLNLFQKPLRDDNTTIVINKMPDGKYIHPAFKTWTVRCGSTHSRNAKFYTEYEIVDFERMCNAAKKRISTIHQALLPYLLPPIISIVLLWSVDSFNKLNTYYY
jgi:hypothetical protein